VRRETLQPFVRNAAEIRTIAVEMDSMGFGPAARAGTATPRATSATTARRLIDQPA
jgi:hypothetical protein